MNKFLRLISTLVVGIGLILLFVYLGFQNSVDKSQVLNQPSYYTLQNYWYLLVSGCGCVAFSIISCFLAWHKMMDEVIEILPNAVAAQKTELLGWLSGSSLDTNRKGSRKTGSAGKKQSTGMSAGKDIEETKTEIPGDTTQQTADGTTDSTVATDGKTVISATGEEMTVLDNTVSAGFSEMTVLDNDATVLTDEQENTVVDDITVIGNR